MRTVVGHTQVVGMFFFSSRRRHTRWPRDWSSDVCSSDLSRTGSYKFMGEEPLLVRRRGGGEKPERRPRRLASTAPHPTVSVPERTDLPLTILCSAKSLCIRSEERRVGKECRSRRATDQD